MDKSEQADFICSFLSRAKSIDVWILNMSHMSFQFCFQSLDTEVVYNSMWSMIAFKKYFSFRSINSSFQGKRTDAKMHGVLYHKNKKVEAKKGNASLVSSSFPNLSDMKQLPTSCIIQAYTQLTFHVFIFLKFAFLSNLFVLNNFVRDLENFGLNFRIRSLLSSLWNAQYDINIACLCMVIDALTLCVMHCAW